VKSTIVVPTFNRPAFVRRCLRYLTAQQCPHAVIIADGSEPAIAEENARATHQASQFIEATHLAYPSDLPFLMRCWEALGHVRTETATFHADDDFLFVRAISDAATLIETDPSLAAAQGQIVIVQNTHAENLARIHTSPTQECTRGTASERLLHWLADYRPLFYATTRTSVLRHAFYEAARLEPPASRLLEIAMCYLVLLQGGVGHLPHVYGVRESHPAATGRGDTSWTDIVCSAEFSPWFARFRERLVQFAAESGVDEGPRLAEAANESFCRYLALAFGKPRPNMANELAQRALTLQLFSPTPTSAQYTKELECVFSIMTSGSVNMSARDNEDAPPLELEDPPAAFFIDKRSLLRVDETAAAI